LADPRERFILPDEPREPRARMRALLDGSPEEGARLINAGHPLADLLWEEWGAELTEAGMDRERFDEITRGYAGELRLWVVGERPWDHCVAGLAGRVLRRLPRQPSLQDEKQELASCGAGR
jgi:hypothetical protein